MRVGRDSILSSLSVMSTRQTLLCSCLLLHLTLISSLVTKTTQGLQFSSYEAKHFPTAVALNISQQCVSDTQQFAEAFYGQEQWAVKSKWVLTNGVCCCTVPPLLR